jgi:hypothetical protein
LRWKSRLRRGLIGVWRRKKIDLLVLQNKVTKRGERKGASMGAMGPVGSKWRRIGGGNGGGRHLREGYRVVRGVAHVCSMN